jgi:hypothetical protein
LAYRSKKSNRCTLHEWNDEIDEPDPGQKSERDHRTLVECSWLGDWNDEEPEREKVLSVKQCDRNPK